MGRVVRRPAAPGDDADRGRVAPARSLATGALDLGGLGLLVWAAAELHTVAGIAAGGVALLVLSRLVDGDDVDEQLPDGGAA